MQLSVKLYRLCGFIFLTIVFFSAWTEFPFFLGGIRGLDQAQSKVGPASLLQERSQYTIASVQRKQNAVIEEVFSEAGSNAFLPQRESAPAAEYAGKRESRSSHCDGRRVYVYDLPAEFNSRVVERCNNSMVSWLNFCPHVQNNGFGRQLLSTEGWYATDAYMLELIFHHRMKTYSCLTLNSSLADAFFIPYYTGLDALRYIYGADKRMKHEQGLQLLRWLEDHAQESWRRWGGKDHFLVAGRTAWDFGNPARNSTDWGTGFLELQAMTSVTAFVLEKRGWRGNEQAVPYPTSFHPSSPQQLHSWIARVQASPRKHLFAFIGAPRPHMNDSIRGILFHQCNASSSACTFVNCSKIKCAHNPEPIVQSLLQAKFCLQPAGDTATRRSTFDCIIAGSIPVFFRNDSAYTQYTWHLPSDPENYSVFIPEYKIRNGTLIEHFLRSYTDKKVKQLQINIRNLIKSILYTGFFDENTSSSSKSGVDVVEDAFELSIKGVTDRVAELKLKSS